MESTILGFWDTYVNLRGKKLKWSQNTLTVRVSANLLQNLHFMFTWPSYSSNPAGMIPPFYKSLLYFVQLWKAALPWLMSCSLQNPRASYNGSSFWMDRDTGGMTSLPPPSWQQVSLLSFKAGSHRGKASTSISIRKSTCEPGQSKHKHKHKKK